MNGELVGATSALQSSPLRPLRAPVHPRQQRCSLKTLAARRGPKEEEEKPQNSGLFGGLTSRIGGGTKQKAKQGTEKVGRTQKAKPAPPPPRKAERKQKPEPARETQKVRAGQPKGNVLGRFGTISSGGRKDANTVFVAGGSGRLGARIVRELLNKGFKVRVGVRDQAQGENLLRTAIDYGLITSDAGRKAQIVEFDLLDEATIGPAIGNASKVVSAIGAAESQPFDVGAPKRIDGDAAIRLVNVAAQSGVQQFTMVTALGTGKFGWPASLLNLFWGILVWKKQAEEALLASGMQYTIVRPGGMEVPRDDHKLTHNVILGERDSTFGGTVSRLQVAELIGAALSEPSLGANKVLEVWSETTAPAADYESLLRAQPNERASNEENVTAAQAVSAVEPGKGLKKQPTQKYAPPKAQGQTSAPAPPKARPGPPPPKPKAATPAAPSKPKNPAELRREEERQQEMERQKQWQASQEAERAANQIPSQQPKPRDLEAEAQEQRERAARNEEYARNRMATEARVQSEAEEERRSARQKQTASRESDKQKRLQAADKEVADARKQAEQQLLSQNKVSKVITPPGTNKLSSAEQDLASAQPSKKLPGAQQGKGETKPAAPKSAAPKAAAPAASKPASSAGASPEQAKKNAEDAAKWIGNWRENGPGSNGTSSTASSNGSSAPSSSASSSPASKKSAQAVQGKARG